jgi:hypothetical protein
MTNDQSTGLSEMPGVAVPDVAAPQQPDADITTMSFDEQMAIARDLMRQWRGVLRELAK